MLVIKAGGGKDLAIDSIVEDLVTLREEGRDLILVHGGAETTNEVAAALGHPPEFITSESGLDGRIFEGRRKAKLRARVGDRRIVIRDDWTGTVEKVNVDLVQRLLDGGYLPVLTPPGASEDGEAINVDGDRAAAVLAAAFGAEVLLILSNVPGLLKEYPDEATLISEIPAAQIESFMAYAEDRMKKKVLGAAEAVAQGVQEVIFGDGRLERPIRTALEGGGTHIG